MKSPESRAKPRDTSPSPRLRCRLRTIDDVRAELARLYRGAKAGQRDISDASKLANMLSILGRMIEGAELEARVERLEDSRGRV